MEASTRLSRLGAGLAMLLCAQLAHPHGDEEHRNDAAADRAPAVAPVRDAPARLADGSVLMPKSAQRLLGIRTTVAKIGQHAQPIELNARVVADPNAAGHVQASQSGRVEPGPQGLPHLGQAVAKGRVLAYLRPVAGAIQRGNQQAQLAELSAQLGLAEHKVKRLEELEGSVPRKEIEAARAELVSLRERKAAVDASLHQPEALVAPVSGVVSAIFARAGQVVEAREVLFEIVDRERLLVEALAYDAGIVGNVAGATAAVPGGAIVLTYLGAGAQLREQALPLQFRIRPPVPPLAVGQPLKITVQTKQRVAAVALPSAALAKSAGGEPIVWAHTDAERFVPRAVRVQPLDARRIAVVSGLAEGERVVTDGASALSQVR